MSCRIRLARKTYKGNLNNTRNPKRSRNRTSKTHCRCSKWNVGELKYPFGNGINFQLEVEDIDKIYNNFKNNNYAIAFDIEENWYRQNDKILGNKEFLIQDPDGYLLRFMQDLGEK